MAGEKEQKKGKSFWGLSRILLVLFLVLGVIIGAAVQHYFIETVLGAEREAECGACFENQDLLNGTINTCIAEKKSVESSLERCLNAPG